MKTSGNVVHCDQPKNPLRHWLEVPWCGIKLKLQGGVQSQKKWIWVGMLHENFRCSRISFFFFVLFFQAWWKELPAKRRNMQLISLRYVGPLPKSYGKFKCRVLSIDFYSTQLKCDICHCKGGLKMTHSWLWAKTTGTVSTFLLFGVTYPRWPLLLWSRKNWTPTQGSLLKDNTLYPTVLSNGLHETRQV